MDQDESKTGPDLTDDREQTSEQLKDEIKQTRVELGDTVAALAEKADVKAQAKGTVNEAKQTASGKVTEVKKTVTDTKDGFVSSAQEATPQSAADAGRQISAFVAENRLPLTVIAAFGMGLLIGKRRAQ